MSPGLESVMALEIASVHSEMVMEMESELELEMASGMPLESKLIGNNCFGEIHDV